MTASENIASNEPVYTISTAARLLGISVHTMRMYEKQHLIIPFKSESNQRMYSQSDIERLRCIRRAINEQKISINGIKTIFALIPCWKILNCGATPETCSVFREHSIPCWAHKHKNNYCELKKCRECEVYLNYNTCDKIKEVLTELTI